MQFDYSGIHARALFVYHCCDLVDLEAYHNQLLIADQKVVFGFVLNLRYKFLKNTEQPLHRVEVHQPHQLLNQSKFHLHEVGAIKDAVDERLADL